MSEGSRPESTDGRPPGLQRADGGSLPAEDDVFELRFRARFLSCRGNAFQDFFADLMEASHRGDFERIRAAGPSGDHKADGRLRSTGVVFQAYAPRDLTPAKAVKKITADYAGALAKWAPGLKGWTLVHNDQDGLPPDAVKLLDALRAKHPTITICAWTYADLWAVVRGLPHAEKVRLLGAPPKAADFERLSFDLVGQVLRAISTHDPEADEPDLRPVSPQKLEANRLGSAAADYLRLGRRRDRLVEDYLSNHADPTLGERVADAFRRRYAELRDAAYEPDDIFALLQEFAGGSARKSVGLEAAALAVLAYLFERCEIFERSGEERTA